ncbi:MAG: hypothetical protein M0P13_00530, partial [Fibrobacteraceae bacterium]|nr:hypothetical protein [Fibrobacteraceae bacterium]
MAKKKKAWKSESLNSAQKSSADKIRIVLCEFAKGRHPAIEDPEKSFDILAKEFEKICALSSEKEILELLAWFLNTDALLENVEEDTELGEAFEDLYADANAFFGEKAKNFEDRAYVIDLLHDLVVNTVGEDARSELFLSAKDFLDNSEIHRLVDDVLASLDGNSLENEEQIYAALQDLADGAGDAELYERLSFLRDPDRSTATLISVANAYYVAGDIKDAERLLKEVKDPATPEEEEEFLDLQTGLLFKKGDKKAALEMAEKLYEKFPKEYHLMCLCTVATKKRKEELL